MSHVFLSHATEDKAKANLVRLALEKRGFKVWWDENVEHGERWEERIAAALTSASAVGVCWSVHSVDSDWVRHEASYALLNQTAVQIKLDNSDVLPQFGSHQNIDFSGWDERENSSQMQALVRAIRMVHRKSRRELLTRLTPYWVSALAIAFAIFSLIKVHGVSDAISRDADVATASPSDGIMIDSLEITIAYGDFVADRGVDIRLPLDGGDSESFNAPDVAIDSGSNESSGRDYPTVVLKKDGQPLRFGDKILATWILPQFTNADGTSSHYHLHAVVDPEQRNQIAICGAAVREGITDCDLYVVYSK